MVKKHIGGDSPSGGEGSSINILIPYQVKVTIQGCSDLLFHRWNCDEVEIKSAAAKGSKTKKTDNRY